MNETEAQWEKWHVRGRSPWWYCCDDSIKTMFAGCVVRSRTPRGQTEGIMVGGGQFLGLNLAACLCFEHGRERARTGRTPRSPRCWAVRSRWLSRVSACPCCLGDYPIPYSRKRPPTFPNYRSFSETANAGVFSMYFFCVGSQHNPRTAAEALSKGRFSTFWAWTIVRVRKHRICIYTLRSKLLSVWPNTLASS